MGDSLLLQSGALQHWSSLSSASSAKDAGSQNAKYQVVRAKPEHFEDVMTFLRNNFFLDEPLNVCIQLVSDARPGACPELEEFAMGALEQGLSLMAVSPEGRVLGVVLNAISQHEDIEQMTDLAEQCPNPKFKLILGLLAHIEKQADVHRRFGVDRVFEMPILSVDSNCRGQGIATALLRNAVELATTLNVPLVRVDCSSKFTAMAVAKLGLQPVYHLKYNTYRPSHLDSAPFNPAYPHDEVASYIKRLN